MAYRDPQLLHLDSDLTEISGGWEAQTDMLIGPKMFPTVRVDKQSNKYRVHNRDLWGRKTPDRRAPGGRTNELPPMTFSRDSYFTFEHALKDAVPVEDDTNADEGLDSMAESTERLSNTILFNREDEQITMATTAANYASGFVVTLAGTTQWSDYTNSDPVGDFKTGSDVVHAVMFREVNTCIMGRAVFRKLEDHTKILARMQGAPLQVTTTDVMQRIFGIPPITVAGAGKLTSNYGENAETVGYWWGKDVWLGYVPPRPGKRTPAFGYEFVRPVGSSQGELMPTERWYDIDRKSNMVRVSREYDNKLITIDSNGKSAGAAYLIKNAVA